jgi:hypothetical protein
MKLKLILTTAIVGTALALPSVSSAAPPAPPLQDSVSLTEAPATFEGGDFGFSGSIEELTATSGPRGENPTGEIMLTGLRGLPGMFLDGGPIATFNYVSEFFGSNVTVQVVDDSPDTISILALGRAATDCSPPPETNVFQLTSGDVTVVDAQGPTTKDQCMGDGWKQFGFANQGLCIAFVNRS